jgi:hypothetical protein
MMGDTCRILVGKATTWKEKRNSKMNLSKIVSCPKAAFIINPLKLGGSCGLCPTCFIN